MSLNQMNLWIRLFSRIFFCVIFFTAQLKLNAQTRNTQSSGKKSFIYQVTPEQFKNAKTYYQNSSDQIIVAEASGPEESKKLLEKNSAYSKNIYDPCTGKYTDGTDPNTEHTYTYDSNGKPIAIAPSSQHVETRVGGDLVLPNFSSSSSDGKEFLVILAVIGAVVVAVMVVYSLTYIISMGFECKAWKEFEYRRYSLVDENDRQKRSSVMDGLEFGQYYQYPKYYLGLIGELGVMDFEINVSDENSSYKDYFKTKSTYLMLGASVVFGEIPWQWKLELLAGTAHAKEIGIMSSVRGGFQYFLDKNLSLGLNIGAMYTQLKNYQGILTNYDDLAGFAGVSLGYRF